MQLMPGTAQSLGVDEPVRPGAGDRRRDALPAEPARPFGGSTQFALAAYNAGAGAVERYGGVPPYAETQNYVSSIMSRLQARSAMS